MRCDSCRRFRALRITRALRERDYRTTRFTCRRCGRQGHCTLDRPDREKGMEDYVLDRGPTRFEEISAAARRTPVGRLFVPGKLRMEADTIDCISASGNSPPSGAGVLLAAAPA